MSAVTEDGRAVSTMACAALICASILTRASRHRPAAPYRDTQGKMLQAARHLHYNNGIALSQHGTHLNVSEHLQCRVQT